MSVLCVICSVGKCQARKLSVRALHYIIYIILLYIRYTEERIGWEGQKGNRKIGTSGGVQSVRLEMDD